MKKIVVLNNTKKNRGLVKRSWASAKASTRYIILAMVPQVIHQITAVLDVPDGNLKRGEKASRIITASTNNAWVTITQTVIDGYVQHLKDYNTATKPAARNAAWLNVHKDLKAIMRLFQEAADNDPENAIVIVESGDFRVKKVTIRQRQVFAVSHGVESGTIDLVGPSAQGRHCHDWWYSADGTNYVRMRPTLESTTQMTGLKPETNAWFMHELIVLKDPQGLSQPIKIQVK